MMSAILQHLATGAQPTLDELVGALKHDIPLLHDLKSTPQDAEWHAEGDVHIHTQMVLNELYQNLNEQNIPLLKRRALILGALLHDIAKPLCTREIEIDGRIRVAALHHEARGRSYLGTRLLEHGLFGWELQTILGCVGCHHLPKRLIKKDLPRGAYLRCDRLVGVESLYRVERADMRGRVCRDWQQQTELIELFHLQAQEYVQPGWYEAGRALFGAAMADRPQPEVERAFGEAVLALEEGQIQTFEEGLFFAHQYRGFCPELVMLVGPSGAGKTTWARHTLQQDPGWLVVSLDAIREELTGTRNNQTLNGQVRQEAHARLKAGLRAGRRIIFEATNLQKERRTQIIQEARNYHALTTLVLFQLPYRVYLKQNRQRKDALPDSVVIDQLSRMDWPEVTEAHRVQLATQLSSA